ncbi:G/U mismatch-specific uracil-DNA glycosylase [Gelidibacter algens]|uniref:G/U mismatch-specific uracil-DNA glycosylase n=1 Tax=Gelidibacter algens TaxID=49280 RepID=A0A1A7R6Q0_9FLAO|nr:uracil-DNA glycosylase family protein [Gelidibacter algens]OBX27173.1 DNA glycosylase [Gelidibacter algens]RAJ22025.1 G/U mismatch-specific uracil-DNA glycosylase [Gelidibacter algens]
MFVHKHPYPPFINEDTTKLIVGTLPPPRFSVGELLEKDVDFCYGSYFNSLWLFIDKIHDLNLRFDNSQEAVTQRKDFLMSQKIGVCDIVESAEREKIDASDLGMKNIQLRNLLGYLQIYPNIDTLLFTGGNSKNGPEYFFRKHLKSHGLQLKVVSDQVPRIHEFEILGALEIPNTLPTVEGSNLSALSESGGLANRIIKTVSLTSGSGAANISISRMPLYQQLKAKSRSLGTDFNTFDFRVLQYREFF